MIRAICVDGIHKTLTLGTIYHVERISGVSRVKLAESNRCYPSNAFSYVDEKGSKLPFNEVRRRLRVQNNG